MYRFGLTLIILFKLVKDKGQCCTECVDLHSNYTFSLLPPANISDASYGLSTSVWTGAQSITGCALMTISRCPTAKGFLYHSASGQCTPLLWLHQESGAAVTSVAPPGDFYLNNHIDPPSVCEDGFDPFGYGSAGDFSCVVVLTSSSSYQSATSECNGLGGYLASVKTAEKLQMVVNLAQGKNMWVGMDDLVKEGTHRWQEDNERLTSEQQAANFKPGEPNNDYGVEDCVHYRASHGNLNDIHCWATMRALCEIQPRTVAC